MSDIAQPIIKEIFEEKENSLKLTNDITLSSKHLRKLKCSNFEYFNLTLSFIHKKSCILLLSFVKTKIHDFVKSKEYFIIQKELENIKFLSYSGINDEYTPKILQKIFPNLQTKKSIRSVNLVILGLHFLHTQHPTLKATFSLPDIHLRKLNTVGKVKRLSAEDKIYKETESKKENQESQGKKEEQEELYPYVLANLIEGSSIYLVKSCSEVSRLGGSSFGATTYWSLVQLLCGYEDPFEAVTDALEGDNDKIDLSVGDIYGGAYEQNSLPGDLIASSFGKLKKVKDISTISKKDISRSLMSLFCLCSGQIISLLTKNAGLKKCFLVGNPFEVLEFMQLIQMTVNYTSKHEVEAKFHDYGSYLPIIGMVGMVIESSLTELSESSLVNIEKKLD